MRTEIVIAIAFGVCGLAVGSPALADRGDHHRGRGRHEQHDRGWHGHRRHFFYSSEPEIYAPPPVVYTPVYPSPGINLVFPLRIR
jgi:hypothetical protein